MYHHGFNKKQIELTEEHLSFDKLPEIVNDLTNKMGFFATKFDGKFSELRISKTCNLLLRKRIIDLERSSLDNAQYLRKEMTEIVPVPLELSSDELEGQHWGALSLTANEVCPDDYEAFHLLKERTRHHQIQKQKLNHKIINN